MRLNFEALLQGTLPADWANQSAVPQLKYLDLSYNYQVSGAIPDDWGNGEGLQSLTKLSFHSCNLTGTLPVSWVDGLPVLSALDLAYNYLTGTQSPFSPQNLTSHRRSVHLCLRESCTAFVCSAAQ